HGDAHDLARRSVVETPDVPRDRRGRHDTPALAHEEVHQAKLRAREACGDAVAFERALLRIEPKRPDLERGSELVRLSGVRSARVRADAGEDLAMAEWLHDVVVRTHLKGAHLVLLDVPAHTTPRASARIQALVNWAWGCV